MVTFTYKVLNYKLVLLINIVTMKSQKDIFTSYEDDNYFKRNKEVVSHKDELIDLKEIKCYLKDNDNILEIGCSNGTKLHFLQQYNPNLKLNLFGVDPSAKAVEHGISNFRNIELKVGTSDFLDYPDGFFDIVIIGFCLYLVDRDLIFKTISEIDRVLKQKGIIEITDFEPPYLYKNKYSHAEGVYSYKNNYSNFFLGGGHYSLIQKIHYSHRQKQFDTDCNERISTTILYKEDYNEIYRVDK